MKLTRIKDKATITAAREAAYLQSLRSDAAVYAIVTTPGEADAFLILEDFEICAGEVNSMAAHFASAPRFWKKRRAIDMVMRFMFEQVGASQVRAEIDVENVPMQVIALKWGFKFDSRLRDWSGAEKVRMTVTETDFKRWGK